MTAVGLKNREILMDNYLNPTTGRGYVCFLYLLYPNFLHYPDKILSFL